MTHRHFHGSLRGGRFRFLLVKREKREQSGIRVRAWGEKGQILRETFLSASFRSLRQGRVFVKYVQHVREVGQGNIEQLTASDLHFVRKISILSVIAAGKIRSGDIR